ncbi:MAG: hypothetical protein GY714_30720 [Desulfobacterales bacterium]|nr:hypothetical protein [Desulfobacterales bacterium]
MKLTIEGIVNSYNGSQKDKDQINMTLTDFVKKIYVDLWIQQATEDEDEVDIELETEDAVEEFQDRFF